ncbi:MAG: glycosyltransferase, partial [Acidimicrobiales bacterium]
MRALAVLSMHTSPLAQPGTGDGGGMNVYVRELSSHLARSGVRVDVFTRADHPAQVPFVVVEPGLRVHHVPAGPLAPVPKEHLAGLVPSWTAGVRARLDGTGPFDAIHANYWLSGLAAHTLKHELDLPLISTFHTLDRVKASASPEEEAAAEPARRSAAEAEIVGCSDAVLASCSVEAEQLYRLYDADPARVEIVAPGVDHAFFGPGDQAQARRAVGLDAGASIALFVGRIQPLKGLRLAVEALGALRDKPEATLVVVGGPSGPHGAEELAAVAGRIDALGLGNRVRMVAPMAHDRLSTFYRAADVCVIPS